MKESLQFIEVTLSRKQLEDALRNLKENKKEQITFLVSDARLIGTEVSGGFSLKPGFVHCRYGCQDDDAEVINAVRSKR